jgi:hypothetical protein
MLSIAPRTGHLDTMTTRSAVIVTIGIIASLMVAMAVAAMYAGDITERQGSIVTSVLGSLATVLAGLLLFLRVETVNGKVDDAADKAAIAAQKAAAADLKIERVHHDMLNGGLRENVKKAISEDRHDKANREAGPDARAQMEDRMRRRAEQQDAP